LRQRRTASAAANDKGQQGHFGKRARMGKMLTEGQGGRDFSEALIRVRKERRSAK
jgi:hypothetical protein